MARPMRAPGGARPGGRGQIQLSIRPEEAGATFAQVRRQGGSQGPTFIPDQDKDPEPVPVKTTLSAVQEAVAEPPAPTNYDNLKQRILARGPQETFFEEDYSIVTRGRPNPVKVAMEVAAPAL